MTIALWHATAKAAVVVQICFLLSPPVSFDSGSGWGKKAGLVTAGSKGGGGYINSGEEGVDKKEGQREGHYFQTQGGRDLSAGGGGVRRNRVGWKTKTILASFIFFSWREIG